VGVAPVCEALPDASTQRSKERRELVGARAAEVMAHGAVSRLFVAEGRVARCSGEQRGRCGLRWSPTTTTSDDDV
jgi:hypothetical protein